MFYVLLFCVLVFVCHPLFQGSFVLFLVCMFFSLLCFYVSFCQGSVTARFFLVTLFGNHNKQSWHEVLRLCWSIQRITDWNQNWETATILSHSTEKIWLAAIFLYNKFAYPLYLSKSASCSICRLWNLLVIKLDFVSDGKPGLLQRNK